MFHQTRLFLIQNITHVAQMNIPCGSKLGIHKPRVLLANKEPLSVQEALQHENWRSAMQDEFLALQRNNTWSLVDLPPDRKAIGSKWVFKLKENPDGSINKYKARLVAKGFY